MKSLILSLLFGFLSLSLLGANYYVSTAGSNSNNGSISSPFLTIGYGVGQLNPGDHLYVRGGTYHQVVNIYNSGTSTDSIFIENYQNEIVIIDGQNNLPSYNYDGLVALGGEYISFKGIEIRNSAGFGIYIEGKHNSLYNLNVNNSYHTGIMGQCDNLLIKDCIVYLNVQNNSALIAQVGWGNGIGVARDYENGVSENCIITGCVVYNNHGEGIDVFESSNVIVEKCVSYDNYTVNLYISDASNVTCRNNLVYTTDFPAIAPRNGVRTGICMFEERAGLVCVSNNNYTTPYSTNNKVYNNLLLNAGISLYTWNESAVVNPGLKNSLIAHNTVMNGNLTIGNLSGHQNSQIKNNIFYGNANSVPTNNGITFSNNLWMSQALAPVNGTSGSDVFGNPTITQNSNTVAGQLTSSYFHLNANSIAIDQGVFLSQTPDDFNGTTRNSSPEIGAFEFLWSSGVLQNENIDNFLEIFPNPVIQNEINIKINDLSIGENVKIDIYNSSNQLIHNVRMVINRS